MARFDAPPLQSRKLTLPAQANGVVRGLNIYASISAAKNVPLQLLAGFLGISLDGSLGITVSVSAPDPSARSKLFFTVGTNINRTTRLDGSMGVALIADKASVFLDATVKTSINRQPLAFNVTALAVPTGVLVSGTMQGMLDLGPVKLANVAIVIGINDVKVPSFGFAATLAVGDFQSSIAIFFDSTDPGRSMEAGSISDVTLLSVAKLLAGQSDIPSSLDEVLGQIGLKGLHVFTLPASAAAALDQRDMRAIRAAFAASGVTLPATDDQVFLIVNTAGSTWHLTNLSTMHHYQLKVRSGAIDVALEPQFYLAPEPTMIGTLRYPQGFHLIAEFDQFLLKARMKVEIAPAKGIAIDADLDPIVIVNRDVFSLTGKSKKGGPLFSAATYKQPEQSDPRLQPPHFFLTGSLHLLGIDVATVEATIGSEGLQWKAHNVTPLYTLDLNGTISAGGAVAINGIATMGMKQSFDASLGPVDLGHVSIDATVSAALDIHIDAGGAKASVSGSFAFAGATLAIPTITLDVNGPALANLPDTLWNAVKDAVLKLFTNVDAWLGAIKSGIVTGTVTAAGAIGTVMAKAYNLTADQIADKTKTALNFTTDQVTSALKGAGLGAEEAAKLLRDKLGVVADVAEDALSGAGYAANEVGNAVTNVWHSVSDGC
ncbi:MAG: hypothetical protein ACJ76J_07410 [Thermoanaerobaculia bacterium]